MHHQVHSGVFTRFAGTSMTLLGYAGLAVVLTWPLILHLRTALPGSPTGDTGVYVWNLWVFRHELIAHGHLPFSTSHIFAFTGGADFSLHNYTPLANLLGLPLIGFLGVVGAFNTVLMIVLALSGWGAYVLSRQVGLRRTPAWLAGALFMAMPLVSAREAAHLSLVTNFALPLFLVALFRTLDQPTWRRGIIVGVMVAMATYSDAYYGIFCVLMGTFVLAWRFLRVETAPPVKGPWRRIVDVLLVSVAGVACAALASGLSEMRLGQLTVAGLDEPYSLTLALVILGAVRVWLSWQPSIRVCDPDARVPRLVTACVSAVASCLLLLGPILLGLAERYASGRLPETSILWRSSPRGVDALAYLVPNPSHAILGHWTARWLLPPIDDAFPELVASCSILALAGILFTMKRHALPRMWMAFTGCFVLLSLGPFIHLAGVNTFIVGPWAVLRYVPVVGMARSPSRFAVVAALGLCLLAGFALDVWLARRQRTITAVVATVVCAVGLEVIPAPRVLYSAAVPDVYQLIATTADEQGRLLELPTGIRDGTSSIGDYNASLSFYQTVHGRPLIGGYLSRVSDWRRRESFRSPMLHALYELSDPHAVVDDRLLKLARASRDRFLARSCVRYVVVDKQRASKALREFATETLGLTPIHEDDRFELLSPVLPPACFVTP